MDRDLGQSFRRNAQVASLTSLDWTSFAHDTTLPSRVIFVATVLTNLAIGRLCVASARKLSKNSCKGVSLAMLLRIDSAISEARITAKKQNDRSTRTSENVVYNVPGCWPCHFVLQIFAIVNLNRAAGGWPHGKAHLGPLERK